MGGMENLELLHPWSKASLEQPPVEGVLKEESIRCCYYGMYQSGCPLPVTL